MADSTEKIWFLDDEPSRRFPLYCRGNVGEIVPNVPTPLSTAITTAAFRHAFREMFEGAGAFRAEELAEASGAGGVFGGYLYFNLSFMRVFATRIVGLRVSDIDQQMLGTNASIPPYRRQPGDRSPMMALRGLVGLTTMVIRRKPADLDAEREATKQWIASLPSEPTGAEVVDIARQYHARFAGSLVSLLDATLGGSMSVSILERLLGRAVRDDAGILVRAISGLGTIETAVPAADLWKLGRMVADDHTLTVAFDQTASDQSELLARLERQRDEPSVGAFLEVFEAFLRKHGHRGPNETELASGTWGSAPATAFAAIERLRFAPAAADPVAATERLTVQRLAAARTLRDRVGPGRRKLVDRLLRAAANGAARREQAKGTLVLDLSGLRMTLFSLADRLVASGAIPDRMAMYMVTVDELPALIASPADFADTIAERRRRYNELNALAPPFWFEGTIPDPSTWLPRGAPPLADASVPTSDLLTGIGVSSGTATGAARIVTDPGDPRGIGDGQVLVAPITDPAWTPLFLAASAVVVDVGALQSHAAVVARELGIPAVVSVEAATSRIRDGDVIEVDGDRGTVRVVSRVR